MGEHDDFHTANTSSNHPRKTHGTAAVDALSTPHHDAAPPSKAQARKARSEQSPAQDNSNDSEQDEGGEGRSPKRRKLGKDVLEKKFVCPVADCDKRYSRAEHLYRHQLNHNPKQIYICDHPGCDRRFVRQDLCVRHQERHNSRESGMVRTTKSRYDLAVTYSEHPPKTNGAKKGASRRDSTLAPQSKRPDGVKDAQNTQNASVKPDRDSSQSPSWARDQVNRAPQQAHTALQQPGVVGHNHASANTTQHSPADRASRPVLAMNTAPPYHDINTAGYSGHFAGRDPQLDRAATAYPVSAYPAFNNYPTQQTYTAHPQPRRNSTAFSPVYQNHIAQSMPYLSPNMSTTSTTHAIPSLSSYTPTFPTFPHLGMNIHTARASNSDYGSNMGDTMYSTMNHDVGPPVTSYMGLNPVSTGPGFNNEIYNNAAFINADNFNQWLFDEDTTFQNHMMSTDMLNEDFSSNRQTPLDFGSGRLEMPQTSTDTSGEPTPAPGPPVKEYHPPRAFEFSISPERRKSLLRFVIDTFHDKQNTLVTEVREKLLKGDHATFPHILSLPMLQTYLSNYWNNIHPQFPILHRPTFATDTCPDFLLLSMLALGSSGLDASHGMERRQLSSDLSFFLAWHVRFRLYSEPDFGPPARLWIFQALLLLEIFEKMYSTRSLHERAHVHHSTTITLIRRGSTLIGRYNQDFAPFSSDPTSTPPSSSGVLGQSSFNTADAEWNGWISLEATRRIAFAAFIIDTTHAHMFGHSAVMVAHEMRLALPCDEAMWAAESMNEVNAIRARLETQEYKQVAFLEALKKTLNQQPVRTNTFGRVSIMAGLLSVSWHMKMQDVRSASTGVGQQGSWGLQLLRAFDFWKKDFDASLQTLAALQPRGEKTTLGGKNRLVVTPLGAAAGAETAILRSASAASSAEGVVPEELDRDNVFEARTVLHHLAHMAMHCDVLDCMMLSGATRLLGRVITPSDRSAAGRRMRDNWAPSARARDSTFYALKFLCSALLPTFTPSSSSSAPSSSGPGAAFQYRSRDDILLNRPWVLYLAALVAWSFGYALEGPLKDSSVVHSLRADRAAQVSDMTAYLTRVGGGTSPNSLGQMEGKNALLGLFMLLRETFAQARWELLHEAADVMGRCISLLVPGVKWDEGIGGGGGGGGAPHVSAGNGVGAAVSAGGSGVTSAPLGGRKIGA